jgi:transcriptional regulator with GAF, ATPase, and Fis domain
MDLGPKVDEDQLILQLRTEAARFLPCDKVCLAFRANGFFQIFDKSNGRQSTVVPAGSQTSIWTAPEANLISEGAADLLHCASGIQAPFKIHGASAGTLLFLATAPQVFRKSDTLIAQRLARSIGIILAKARSTNQASEGETCVEPDWKDDLVQAVCEVPDIHRILPKISNLLRGVIPHDRLTISFHDRDRNMSMRSVSNNNGPTFQRVNLASDDFPRDGSSVIINDLVNFSPGMEPNNFHPRVIDAGYRSYLITHVWTGKHGLGFVFWSKRGDAFHRRHVPSAQQIADLCAVAVSKERLVPRIDLPEKPAAYASATSDMQLPNRQENVRREEKRGDLGGYPRQRSAAWSAVVQSAKQVAATDTTVLLVGETGTGKEVIARLIYSESARRSGPFVPVNCAALPDTLLESELFGFERGAFTGAYHHKRGYIELAQRGVLFLDELSEMSLGAQGKLLRVLETREFQPLGSTRSQKADIRVMAATNKDLREEIRAGRFRADLYYRLGVFEISLPPLRSRKQDILPLAYKFLSDVSSGARKPAAISPRAEEALLHYDWPGNVRELRNVIERASILCDDRVIDVEQLAFRTRSVDHSTENEISVVERKMIERAMRECGGNKARAARTLGLSRTQLYVRLRRYF